MLAPSTQTPAEATQQVSPAQQRSTAISYRAVNHRCPRGHQGINGINVTRSSCKQQWRPAVFLHAARTLMMDVVVATTGRTYSLQVDVG